MPGAKPGPPNACRAGQVGARTQAQGAEARHERRLLAQPGTGSTSSCRARAKTRRGRRSERDRAQPKCRFDRGGGALASAEPMVYDAAEIQLPTLSSAHGHHFFLSSTSDRDARRRGAAAALRRRRARHWRRWRQRVPHRARHGRSAHQGDGDARGGVLPDQHHAAGPRAAWRSGRLGVRPGSAAGQRRPAAGDTGGGAPPQEGRGGILDKLQGAPSGPAVRRRANSRPRVAIQRQPGVVRRAPCFPRTPPGTRR